MTLRFALLGLLDERSGSGYDLTRRFAAGIEQFAWGARHSQIYPELNRLAEEGLVAVQSTGARGRKVYEVTAAGREQLQRWLLEPSSDRGTVRNEFVLRLFLLRSLPPERVLEVLEGVESFAADRLRALEADRAASGVPDRSAFAATYGLFTYAAVRDWAAWLIEQIRAGADLQRVPLPEPWASRPVPSAS